MVGRRWFSYLFQCSLLLYKAGNMIGRIVDALSLIRLRMYSLFQKYRARSATCWLSYTKKKKIVKNPKQEHLRNQSISKQSYKRNTRQKKFWLVQQLVKEKTKLCLVTRYIMDSYKKNKKKTLLDASNQTSGLEKQRWKNETKKRQILVVWADHMMHMMSPQSETAKIWSNVLLIPVLLGAI